MIAPTLDYCVGVFEGIHCYQTPRRQAMFCLQDHLEKFLDSINILGVFDFLYSVEAMSQAFYQIISANGFSECSIRPLMYLQSPLGLNNGDCLRKRTTHRGVVGILTH